MDAQKIKEKLQDVFSTTPEIDLAYLFGSRVEGETGPMSDIDLGVLVAKTEGIELIQAQLAHKVRGILKTDRVDVILLNRTPIELAYAVISQGTCIFQRDTATRVEFEANTMSRYGDYLPVLRAQREEVLRGEGHDRRAQRYREALRRTERTLSQIKTTKR
ncbi:MAG: nucleotidyltransferase domain-containing protein [Anaerolineales bacterium]|jgi:predicted nucleotidyltransferase